MRVGGQSDEGNVHILVLLPPEMLREDKYATCTVEGIN